MARNQPISGFEFVKSIIAQHRDSGDIFDVLAKCAGSQECDWLEFKASPFLLPDDDSKSKRQLYIWKLAREIIAIANTSGGVLLFGIHDRTLEPVNIPMPNGAEDFIRKDLLPKFTTDNWVVDNKKYSASLNLEDFIVPDSFEYKGHTILALLIKPCDDGTAIIVTPSKEGQDLAEVLIHRRPGRVGECVEIHGFKEISEYQRKRTAKTEQFSIWETELRSNDIDATVQHKIAQYYLEFEKHYNEEYSQAKFTRLTASGITTKESNPQPTSPMVIGFVGRSCNTTESDSDQEGATSTDDEGPEIQRICKDLFTILDEYPRVKLTGEPGAGKTTCLTYRTLQSCKQGANKLQFYLSLRFWTKKDLSVETAIANLTNLTPLELEYLISNDRLSLVFDALNECPEDRRTEAVHAIASFIAQPGHNRIPIVISARREDELTLFDQSFQHFSVEPIHDRAQKLRFLSNALGDEVLATRVLNDLERSNPQPSLTESPILLSMVADLVQSSNATALPTQKTELYGKWIDGCIETEFDKATQSRKALPFTKDALLRKLAELAFASRLLGQYNFISLDIVGQHLGTLASLILEKFCNGPLLIRKNNSIEFRHETFQEYLCALHLVQNPTEIAKLNNLTYRAWGMPLAYCFEICKRDNQKLPIEFSYTATKINFWFGLAINGLTSGLEHMVNAKDKGKLDLCMRIHKQIKSSSCETLCVATLIANGDWYAKQDGPLSYCINTSSQVLSRWQEFETRCFVHYFSCYSKKSSWSASTQKFVSNMITLSRDVLLRSNPRQFRLIIDKLNTPNIISLFLSEGIAIKSDLSPKWQEYFSYTHQNTSIEQLISLVQSKCYSEEELKDLILAHVENATPATALQLIKGGVATPQDFKDKISTWLQANTKKLIATIPLLTTQTISQQERQDIIDELIRTAKQERKPRLAIKLVKAGIVQPNTFEAVLPKWQKDCSANLIQKLVANGFYSDEALSTMTDTLVEKSSDNAMVFTWLIRNGYIKKSAPCENLISCSAIHSVDSLIKVRSQLRARPFRAKVAKAIFYGESNPSNTLILDIPEIEGFVTCREHNLRTSLAQFTGVEHVLVRLDLLPNLRKEGAFMFSVKSISADSHMTPKYSLKGEQSAIQPQSKIMNDKSLLDKFNKRFNLSPLDVPTPSKHQDPNALTIYIDETWPGTQDSSLKDTGVIGGIVWQGPVQDNVLRHIPTHMRSEGKGALKRLLSCNRATPFAFPVTLKEKFRPNDALYLSLVEDAIIILLGWILPRPQKPTNITIYLEHFGNQFNDNHVETDRFHGIFEALKKLQGSNRFSNFHLETVKWVPKDFEYIPYGDLVSYLCTPTKHGQEMAEYFKLTDWPGYLPFKADVLPALRDIDSNSPRATIDAIITLSKTCRGTNLYKTILNNAIARSRFDDSFRSVIMQRLEECYQDKDRDLSVLNSITSRFLSELSDDSLASAPHLLLKKHLLTLQMANHNGDPDVAMLAASTYQKTRSRVIRIDPELTAYTDLNLAVHYHDLFEFDKGAEVVEQWITDNSFAFLPLKTKGRLYSSLGQSNAMLENFQEADNYFHEALSLFNQEQTIFNKEIQQTKIYIAHNKIDAKTELKREQFESTIGVSLDAAASDPSVFRKLPFCEHLFVKYLWQDLNNPLTRKIAQRYISKAEHWEHGTQHPWELIVLYRGLLLHAFGKTECHLAFKEIESLYSQMQSEQRAGATLQLIHAFTYAACKLCCGIVPSNKKLETVFCGTSLPTNLAQKLSQLKRIYDTGAANDAELLWKTLPFNYK